MNTLQLCSKLINVIEATCYKNNILQYDNLYPLSDIVMYYYYLGRLKLFEDKYNESRDYLLLALKYVPNNINNLKNRQRIMINLVAVNVITIIIIIYLF